MKRNKNALNKFNKELYFICVIHVSKAITAGASFFSSFSSSCSAEAVALTTTTAAATTTAVAVAAD